MTGEELHGMWCADNRPCARWEWSYVHRDYYRDKADELNARLEPLIGAANVLPVIQAITEVLR